MLGNLPQLVPSPPPVEVQRTTFSIDAVGRFVCSLCVCAPDGRVLAAIEESCEGTLLAAAAGSGGFGYDPIFVPVEFSGDPSRTFAQLDAATKDRLSHRGKALRRLCATLPRLLR